MFKKEKDYSPLTFILKAPKVIKYLMQKLSRSSYLRYLDSCGQYKCNLEKEHVYHVKKS